MNPADRAIPILPSRSITTTAAFYRALGFEGGPHEDDSNYGILRRGSLELHFFTHVDLKPEDSWAGCYLRVADVQSIYEAMSALGLPGTGIPRVVPLEDKPWGLREFAVVDPDGNLLRIGQVI
jgi:catechol 2,3-dioxygenase-like lactoylglutathione lyase family enzyme